MGGGGARCRNTRTGGSRSRGQQSPGVPTGGTRDDDGDRGCNAERRETYAADAIDAADAIEPPGRGLFRRRQAGELSERAGVSVRRGSKVQFQTPYGWKGEERLGSHLDFIIKFTYNTVDFTRKFHFPLNFFRKLAIFR